MTDHRTANVAVIGAGSAGLAVAHELLKEGHSVTVFEASTAVGGAWLFDSSIDSDPLALDPNRTKVHSSMYRGLRTNLPRSVMTFLDFPFIPEAMQGLSCDPRMYPLHTEVLTYYQAFADTFDLNRHIQFNTTVLSIDPLQPAPTAAAVPAITEAKAEITVANRQPDSSGSSCDDTQRVRVPSYSHTGAATAGLQWRVLTSTRSHSTTLDHVGSTSTSRCSSVTADYSPHQQQPEQQQQQREWVFDAVASCVGIFSEPNLPQVDGIATWPGLQLHSHNYRSPEQFAGKTVLVVGASFSGEEIARAIACTAAQVYHSARTFTGPGTARELKHADSFNSACCTAGSASQQQQPQLCSACTPKRETQQIQPQTDAQRACTTQQQPIIPAPEPRQNIERVAMLQHLLDDGSVVLQGGRVLHGVDAVLHCTGYKYSYPWMEHLGIVETDGGHVRPLYLHMFPPAYAPSLALVGLPWRCAKIPQFQLQGQLLAKLLSGKAALPSLEAMLQDQQSLFELMAAEGIPRRYMHCQADFMPENQWMYADKLISLAAAASSLHQQQRQQQQQQRHWHHENKVPQVPIVLQDQQLGINCCIQQETEQQQQQQQCSVHLCQPGLQLQQAAIRLHSGVQKQQGHLLVLPNWLKAVAEAVSGDILSRPDSFRDSWTNTAAVAMEAAHQEMLHLWRCVEQSVPGAYCDPRGNCADAMRCADQPFTNTGGRALQGPG